MYNNNINTNFGSAQGIYHSAFQPAPLEMTQTNRGRLPNGLNVSRLTAAKHVILETISRVADQIFRGVGDFLQAAVDSFSAKIPNIRSMRDQKIDRLSRDVLPAPATKVSIASTSDRTSSCLEIASDISFLTKPAEILLSPIDPNNPEIERIWQTMKEKLEKSKLLNVKFDDASYQITLYHGPKEVQAIFQKENLMQYMATSIAVEANLRVRAKGDAIFGVARSSATDYEKREAELLKKTADFFKDKTFEEVAVNGNYPKKKIISSIFKEHQGLCIGEIHSESSPKKFLIDHMKELKKEGVTTLFMEHLFYDSMQGTLDEYFQLPPGSKMPPKLEIFLNDLSKRQRNTHNKYNFTEVVRAAKEAGIRVVAIDTTVSYLCGTNERDGVHDSKKRYEAMNFTAAAIIQKERGDGKFVALMGSAHVGTTEGVPGVGNIMGCPNMVIEDAEEKESISFNVNNLHEKIEHVGIFLQQRV